MNGWCPTWYLMSILYESWILLLYCIIFLYYMLVRKGHYQGCNTKTFWTVFWLKIGNCIESNQIKSFQFETRRYIEIRIESYSLHVPIISFKLLHSFRNTPSKKNLQTNAKTNKKLESNIFEIVKIIISNKPALKT